MERLLGPNLEVILSLNEGNDFGFLGSPFIITASLDGNCIETNTFASEQCIKFHTELIWQSNKNNIKKMKSFKVPIKLDFHKIEVNGSRTHFGYIIINLKTAQYVPKDEYLALREDVVKVVGLGKEAKGSSPQVQLSLRIQDVEENDDVQTARRGEDVEEQSAFPCLESESSIDVFLPVEQYHTKEVEKHVSTSRTNTIPQGRISPQTEVQVYHSLHLEIALEEIKWLSSFSMVHFRFHHARADVSWSAHEDIGTVDSGKTTNLKSISAQLRFVEVPAYLPGLLLEVPPVVSLCTLRLGRPVVLAKSHLKMPTLEKTVVKHKASLLDLKTQEVVALLTYTATLTDIGPHTFHQSISERADECNSERFRNELEMWKEKEKAVLEENGNKKLQAELQDLQTAWETRQKELEAAATERMEECRRLSEVLLQASEDVKKKQVACEEREKSLEQTKIDLETSYSKLLAETRHETASLREDLLERLKEKDSIIFELQKENERLKNQVEEVRAQCSALSREQIETLLQDMRKLQEKLERANNSKMFFKEQWGRAVREVHRIKTDGWKDIQVQLQYKKDELKQLGLECLLNSDNQGFCSTRSTFSAKDSDRGDRACDEKLREMIRQRDFLLLSGDFNGNSEELTRLNRDIRQLLEN